MTRWARWGSASAPDDMYLALPRLAHARRAAPRRTMRPAITGSRRWLRRTARGSRARCCTRANRKPSRPNALWKARTFFRRLPGLFSIVLKPVADGRGACLYRRAHAVRDRRLWGRPTRVLRSRSTARPMRSATVWAPGGPERCASTSGSKTWTTSSATLERGFAGAGAAAR